METADTMLMTWMSRVWNARDAGAIDELLVADAPVHGLGDEPLPGTAGFKEFHSAFLSAFSDINIEVERQVVHGDQVAAHWTGTLLHTGTGKTVPASGMVIATVRDGKMQEAWNAADFLPMLIALGHVDAEAMDRVLG